MKYKSEFKRLCIQNDWDWLKIKEWIEEGSERKRNLLIKEVCQYNLKDEDNNCFECSICGRCWNFIEGDPYNNGMKFCPRCGRFIESIILNK